MKKKFLRRTVNRRLIIITLILLAVIIAAALGFWQSGIFSGHKDTPQPTKKQTVAQGQSKTDNQKQNKLQKKGTHPYGNPVEGALMWEDNANFKDICSKYDASIRMSAFQTTLPDPLPGEEENVRIGAAKLAGTVVQPGEVFSMNRKIGPYTREMGYKIGPTYAGNKVVKTIGGGVCKIATTLYNVATLANLQIVERHNHAMLVPYVPAGQDATVYYGVLDIKFRNSTNKPIVIWAETDTKTNTLYMAIYGSKHPPAITWGHVTLNREKYKTVYTTNNSLQPGKEKVILPGEDGLTVKSWLQIKREDGTTDIRPLGVDYYQPMPRVIERGASK